MKTVNIDIEYLATYVRKQITQLFPLEAQANLSLIGSYLPSTLKRLNRCIDEIRMWHPGQFDVLHSTQYCIFLYYLSNTIWQETEDRQVCTLIFLLNKALNGIDLFYEIQMPDVFFIGHSVGIVLAKATYGNYLVLYQNSTVGKNHGIAPILEDRVIMYPNTAVIGSSRVRNGSVISQGVSVINQETPGNSLVFQSENNTLTFKKISKQDLFADFFR